VREEFFLHVYVDIKSKSSDAVCLAQLDYGGYTFTDDFSWTHANLWCGAVALLSFSIMVVTSFPFVRRKLFEVFFYMHVAFKTLGLVSALLFDQLRLLTF
jgi:hypothetical protein